MKKPVMIMLKLKDVYFLDFNRAINMALVDKILNSAKKFGIQRLPNVVKANIDGKGMKYYWLDGQHLATALIKAGETEISCLLYTTNIKREIVELMTALNNTGKPWIIANYVSAFSSLAIDSYNVLKAHHFSTGFTFAISAEILGNPTMSIVKNGAFKANNKDADLVTKTVIDVCSLMETSNAKFMKAFIRFFRSPAINYNHKLFMIKLASNKEKFIMAHDTALIKQQFEKLYA